MPESCISCFERLWHADYYNLWNYEVYAIELCQTANSSYKLICKPLNNEKIGISSDKTGDVCGASSQQAELTVCGCNLCMAGIKRREKFLNITDGSFLYIFSSGRKFTWVIDDKKFVPMYFVITYVWGVLCINYYWLYSGPSICPIYVVTKWEWLSIVAVAESPSQTSILSCLLGDFHASTRVCNNEKKKVLIAHLPDPLYMINFDLRATWVQDISSTYCTITTQWVV